MKLPNGSTCLMCNEFALGLAGGRSAVLEADRKTDPLKCRFFRGNQRYGGKLGLRRNNSRNRWNRDGIGGMIDQLHLCGFCEQTERIRLREVFSALRSGHEPRYREEQQQYGRPDQHALGAILTHRVLPFWSRRNTARALPHAGPF